MGLMQLLAPLLAVILAIVLALLAAWALSMSAAAQITHPTAEALASYAGADRMEKLIAGAKKEGSVAVYSSAAMDDMAAIIAAFEKKYGVKVRLWRGSSENIVQRAVTEARGGRFEADVIETGALAMESMRRERLFEAIKTPALSELLPAAIPAHREWIGTRFNIFVAAYNTRLIKKDELPQSYGDLLDRRWKGKLGVEAEDSDWLVLSPGVARLEGIGVARRAARPHAAILFFDFMLTDAQDILRDRDFFPARANAKSLPEGADLHFLDPVKALDDSAKWSKYFREIVATPR
jgi:ABC-type Fe3+ transport system substrate-binding protein